MRIRIIIVFVLIITTILSSIYLLIDSTYTLSKHNMFKYSTEVNQLIQQQEQLVKEVKQLRIEVDSINNDLLHIF